QGTLGQGLSVPSPYSGRGRGRGDTPQLQDWISTNKCRGNSEARPELRSLHVAEGRAMTKGRITRKFEALRGRSEAALVPFIGAGDPDLTHTGMLVMEMEARGADIIELGIPFSDPMADGPANQRALARGMAGGGSLSAVLGLVRELRQQTQIPIILFGYFN